MTEQATTLLTVRQVAQRLALDPKTVYEMIWSNEIESTRVGPTGRAIRVSEAQLAHYIERNARGALARR
ncbi:MAG: helix-turn-helix domain-containing protein [Actinobacteria bacterium]|jgi:excisionase family DNA binding protein|nr:helix-turn-helix domain-containing protein [Actinomycetota bacterium]